MRQTSTYALLALLFVLHASSVAFAQWPMENHYKVYTTQQEYSFTGPIVLSDQFGTYTVSLAVLDKFANPTEKNGEPILFPEAHQTWWRLDIPTAGYDVIINNQFGEQPWHLGNVRYLVLPARKNEPGPLPEQNHYLGYEATGDSLLLPVTLVDQFGVANVVVVRPVMLLTPVSKAVQGQYYPIVDAEAHLAVYRIDPIMNYDNPLVAFDQFGTWQLNADQAVWLCVPSYKRLGTSPTESSTWGSIKDLFR